MGKKLRSQKPQSANEPPPYAASVEELARKPVTLGVVVLIGSSVFAPLLPLAGYLFFEQRKLAIETAQLLRDAQELKETTRQLASQLKTLDEQLRPPIDWRARIDSDVEKALRDGQQRKLQLEVDIHHVLTELEKPSSSQGNHSTKRVAQ